MGSIQSICLNVTQMNSTVTCTQYLKYFKVEIYTVYIYMYNFFMHCIKRWCNYLLSLFKHKYSASD